MPLTPLRMKDSKRNLVSRILRRRTPKRNVELWVGSYSDLYILNDLVKARGVIPRGKVYIRIYSELELYSWDKNHITERDSSLSKVSNFPHLRTLLSAVKSSGW